ncbi:MAG: DUF3426 domain-containing protein [Azonexus sp.]
MPGRNQTLMRTRCPACSTVFRVTSDQLRAKAGKVRCGYCQAVFNAFDELLDEARPAAATQTLGEEQINLDAATTEYAPDEQADAIETAEPGEAGLITDSETGEETDAAETAVTPEGEPDIEVAGEDEPVPDEHPDAVPEERDSDAGEQGEIDPSATLTATETEPPSAQVVDEKPEEATHAAREAGMAAARELSEAPAFDRWAAGALSGSNSGGFETDDGGRTNWVFVIAAVLLATILSAQLAYHFRTELVRFIPAAAGVFEALDVQVPQSARSDLVSIEASDLQVDNARGLFVLNAVLHNRADYAQAMPALELTLIDAADAPVARRVMKPAEYLPPGSNLTSFPAKAEIPVRMWIDARGLGASGYRLYIFYP